MTKKHRAKTQTKTHSTLGKGTTGLRRLWILKLLEQPMMMMQLGLAIENPVEVELGSDTKPCRSTNRCRLRQHRAETETATAPASEHMPMRHVPHIVPHRSTNTQKAVNAKG